jgi:tetratricopeptide (TPR) repeat protein
MKQYLIVILLLLSACSPRNANLPVMSQQDTRSNTFRKDLAKIKEGLTTTYAVSPKGEVNLNAEKGNAYVKWDEQGMTMFLSRDFVPSPSYPLAEKLNKFLTEFHQSVYSNAEGKIFVPGTDVYLQFDDKGITLFVPKTEGVEAYYDSGVAYYNQGQYDKAISDFTKALEINPKFAEAYNRRGIVYGIKGRYDEAISDFSKALEINSKFAGAYYGRGITYGGKGQYDEAISDYNKALEINPKFAEAYNRRGIAYSEKGRYDEAISDYTKALEINPRYALACYNRGIAYCFKGEYEKSWKDIEKAQSLGFVTRPEFVHDLRKASGIGTQSAAVPWTPTATIVNFGIFEVGKRGKKYEDKESTAGYAEEVGETTLLKKTTDIPLKKGIIFGIVWEAQGLPNIPIKVAMRVKHPQTQKPDGTVSTGFDEMLPFFPKKGRIKERGDYYALSEDWEMLPGEWSLSIVYEGKVLCEKVFRVIAP